MVERSDSERLAAGAKFHPKTETDIVQRDEGYIELHWWWLQTSSSARYLTVPISINKTTSQILKRDTPHLFTKIDALGFGAVIRRSNFHSKIEYDMFQRDEEWYRSARKIASYLKQLEGPYDKSLYQRNHHPSYNLNDFALRLFFRKSRLGFGFEEKHLAGMDTPEFARHE